MRHRKANHRSKKWLSKSGRQARARLIPEISRLREEYKTRLKPVGDGVFEYWRTWGGGIRVYHGREGDERLILLYGGTKSRQGADIDMAKRLWITYKAETATERKG